jgi:hypothetical protein
LLYSFFNLGDRWECMVNAMPRLFYSRERRGTHCVGSWVGPRTGLDWCGKSRSHGFSIPGPSTLWRVAIPTELTRPTEKQLMFY